MIVNLDNYLISLGIKEQVLKANAEIKNVKILKNNERNI
jgi:hypothetical protein